MYRETTEKFFVAVSIVILCVLGRHIGKTVFADSPAPQIYATVSWDEEKPDVDWVKDYTPPYYLQAFLCRWEVRLESDPQTVHDDGYHYAYFANAYTSWEFDDPGQPYYLSWWCEDTLVMTYTGWEWISNVGSSQYFPGLGEDANVENQDFWDIDWLAN